MGPLKAHCSDLWPGMHDFIAIILYMADKFIGCGCQSSQRKHSIRNPELCLILSSLTDIASAKGKLKNEHICFLNYSDSLTLIFWLALIILCSSHFNSSIFYLSPCCCDTKYLAFKPLDACIVALLAMTWCYDRAGRLVQIELFHQGQLYLSGLYIISVILL